MKKKTKKNIYTIILIALGIVLFIKYISSVHFMYKVNWNINIPNPKSVETIYENSGFQFGQYLDVMNYSKKNINKLIKRDYFKKIEKENKEFLEKKYNDFITINSFMKDNEELQQLYDNTIQPNIKFNENNYYALFEEGYLNSIKYNLIILIIDTENNNMYSIQFYR